MKYTLGFDYTFPANIYLNVQYVHGFFHEEGRKNLTDWLAWTCEWKSADEKLKLSLLNGAFQVADFNNLKEGCTLFWLPELSYKPVDNVELKAGAHCIFTGKDAPFYPIRKNGDAYLKVKYSFQEQSERSTYIVSVPDKILVTAGFKRLQEEKIEKIAETIFYKEQGRACHFAGDDVSFRLGRPSVCFRSS